MDTCCFAAHSMLSAVLAAVTIQLFGQTDRVPVQGKAITHDDNSRLLCLFCQHGSHEVRRWVNSGFAGVMFRYAYAVEA